MEYITDEVDDAAAVQSDEAISPPPLVSRLEDPNANQKPLIPARAKRLAHRWAGEAIEAAQRGGTAWSPSAWFVGLSWENRRLVQEALSELRIGHETRSI